MDEIRINVLDYNDHKRMLPFGGKVYMPVPAVGDTLWVYGDDGKRAGAYIVKQIAWGVPTQPNRTYSCFIYVEEV